MGSKLPAHSPPGYPLVDDLTAENKALWSNEFISNWMNAEIERGPNICRNEKPSTKLTHFFDGTVTPFNVGQAGVDIGPWEGFPGKLKNTFGITGDDARKMADSSKDVQDEYLEWSVERLHIRNKSRDTGPIKRVVFTCEGPEYWEFFAAQQADTMIPLVKELNKGVANFDRNFAPDDLFNSDSRQGVRVYNSRNTWNWSTTTGTILHLAQVNNTLGAQVDIAAQATVIRKDVDDEVITDQTQLIECSGYGDRDRNSDPMIGSMVNTAAREGSLVSLKDPVGLYMHSFTKDQFQLPYDSTNQEYSVNGSDRKAPPAGTFTFQRGDINKHMGLRLKIQIPDGVTITTEDGTKRQANVSDLLDENNNDENVKYGSHFAENIMMHLYGVTLEGGQPAAPINCPCQKSKTENSAANVAEESPTIVKGFADEGDGRGRHVFRV